MAVNQWARIKEKNINKLRTIARKSFIEASGRVIMMSPVDTGRFRNNWFFGLNSASSQMTEETNKQGRTEYITQSSSVQIGDAMYLTNNLSYAEKLEYGYSNQAPQGMVRLMVAQWPFIVAGFARETKND